LRRLAAQQISQERPGQTLNATALVHEAYLRLVDGDRDNHWNSRRHFIAAAAQAMRRILVERARARGSLKRGGRRERVILDDRAVVSSEPPEELLALDEALTGLAANASRMEAGSRCVFCLVSMMSLPFTHVGPWRRPPATDPTAGGHNRSLPRLRTSSITAFQISSWRSSDEPRTPYLSAIGYAVSVNSAANVSSELSSWVLLECC
jgi:hypothetical protein